MDVMEIKHGRIIAISPAKGAYFDSGAAFLRERRLARLLSLLVWAMILKKARRKEMTISVSEFRKNPSKYLALAQKEDVSLTKYGRLIAKIVKPDQSIHALRGILPSDVDPEMVKEERLSKI
jgi:antitoxin (DNA-binding transcriptional repressor) of toxin-antitoxin stability system